MNRRRFLSHAPSLAGAASLAAMNRTPMPSDQIEVVHTRVFAASRKGGNPCPVVRAGGQLTDSKMQDLARRFGLDTAFILQPQSKAADLRIRYFVPDHEMGVSGHATIAAITVALADNIVHSDRIRIETSSGLFESNWIRRSGGYAVTLEQNPAVFGPDAFGQGGGLDQVAHALNIHASEIAAGESPVQSVSVSRAKLLVPLKDSGILNRLTPNFDTLWKLCDDLQVSGLYPFTRHTNKASANAEARQFPLRAGFPEDAATGVAAAALGAYLAQYDLRCSPGRHEFRIAQGYAMGAPSLIETIAECADGKVTRTAIRGMAHIVRHERIRV